MACEGGQHWRVWRRPQIEPRMGGSQANGPVYAGAAWRLASGEQGEGLTPLLAPLGE